MPATSTPLTGDELLAAVTEAMVALHHRYHHRKPVTAKTLLLGDDLLACVLAGVYTDVEKTMIELQRTTIVRETRNAFQHAMQHKFIGAIERLSGREVLAFMSNHHVGPDIEIELFMLTPDHGDADSDGAITQQYARAQHGALKVRQSYRPAPPRCAGAHRGGSGETGHVFAGLVGPPARRSAGRDSAWVFAVSPRLGRRIVCARC